MTIPDVVARMRAWREQIPMPKHEAQLAAWASEIEAEWKQRDEFLRAAMKYAAFLDSSLPSDTDEHEFREAASTYRRSRRRA